MISTARLAKEHQPCLSLSGVLSQSLQAEQLSVQVAMLVQQIVSEGQRSSMAAEFGGLMYVWHGSPYLGGVLLQVLLTLSCCDCIIIRKAASGGTWDTSHVVIVADVSPGTSLLHTCSLLIFIQGWSCNARKADLDLWLQLPMGWWALCTHWRSRTGNSQAQTSALVWICGT